MSLWDLLNEPKEEKKEDKEAIEKAEKEAAAEREDHNCAPSEPVIDFVRQWAAKYKFTGAYVGKEG